MKMWVDLNLRLRRHMTVKTNRLATTDIKTKKKTILREAIARRVIFYIPMMERKTPKK